MEFVGTKKKFKFPKCKADIFHPIGIKFGL